MSLMISARLFAAPPKIIGGLHAQLRFNARSGQQVVRFHIHIMPKNDKPGTLQISLLTTILFKSEETVSIALQRPKQLPVFFMVKSME